MKRKPDRYEGRSALTAIKSCLVVCMLFVLTALEIQAQTTGGRSKLDFLNLPSQAQSGALGTHHFTMQSNDPATFLQSPVQLDTHKINHASASVMPYFADTYLATVAYANRIGKSNGVWGAGIQYLNYGTMPETDPAGNVIGEFRAADYGLSVGYGHTINAFTVGGTARFVGGSIADYNTYGLAFDWSAVFKHPKQDLTIGFTVKNLGFLRQNFTGAVDPVLPLDVRLGLSVKPEYMPVRVTATIHHLNRFDMVYNDPALFYTYDLNGSKLPRKVGVVEKMARHISIGAEVLLHPKFKLMLGYDHLRRQELRLHDRGALAGFSFGAWLKIRQFEIGYGRSQYTPGTGAGSISIVMNLTKGAGK